jgi:MFS family permease
VLTALWGYLSDRFGRKKILILLAALTIVSNLIYIFSITYFSFSWLSSSPMSERGERGRAVKAAGLLIRWSRPCWLRNVLRQIAIGFSPPTLLSARLWVPWAHW